MSKTSLPVVAYQCEPGCGACCAYPIIEVDELDIVREPRLKEACGEPSKTHELDRLDYTDDDTGEDLGPLALGWEAGGMLACGPGHPCPLLTVDKSCSIYPSRPNVCVAFRAGSGQCRDARKAHGLSPLSGNHIG